MCEYDFGDISLIDEQINYLELALAACMSLVSAPLLAKVSPVLSFLLSSSPLQHLPQNIKKHPISKTTCRAL